VSVLNILDYLVKHRGSLGYTVCFEGLSTKSMNFFFCSYSISLYLLDMFSSLGVGNSLVWEGVYPNGYWFTKNYSLRHFNNNYRKRTFYMSVQAFGS